MTGRTIPEAAADALAKFARAHRYGGGRRRGEAVARLAGDDAVLTGACVPLPATPAYSSPGASVKFDLPARVDRDSPLFDCAVRIKSGPSTGKVGRLQRVEGDRVTVLFSSARAGEFARVFSVSQVEINP